MTDAAITHPVSCWAPLVESRVNWGWPCSAFTTRVLGVTSLAGESSQGGRCAGIRQDKPTPLNLVTPLIPGRANLRTMCPEMPRNAASIWQPRGAAKGEAWPHGHGATPVDEVKRAGMRSPTPAATEHFTLAGTDHRREQVPRMAWKHVGPRYKAGRVQRALPGGPSDPVDGRDRVDSDRVVGQRQRGWVGGPRRGWAHPPLGLCKLKGPTSIHQAARHA